MLARLMAFSSMLLCAACLPPSSLQLGSASNAGPVTCDSGCVLQWQRAQVWINKHSHYKIQTATDVIVQTYNSTGSDLDHSFTAQKEPLGGQKYQITLDLACANMFGCSYKTEDVRAAFYYYVATGTDVVADKGAL